MKTIYLVRHGKAVSRDTDIDDFDRPLIERGENDVLQVAMRLKERGVKPSLLITSPAKRALQTTRIIARQLGLKRKDMRKRKAAYYQAENSLLDIVHMVGDEHDCVMLIGHNPSMDDFARFLIRDIKEYIPTSGVVGIECNAGSWSDISEGQSKLKLFDFPRKEKKTDVKITKKSMRKTLEAKLVEQIGNILNEVHTTAKEKMEKAVKKSSRIIAEKFVKAMKKPPNKKSKK